MSGGDRGERAKVVDWAFPLIGLVIAIAVAWGVGWLQAREKYNREQSAAAYQAAANEDAKRSCVGSDPSTLFECVDEKIKASYQARHDQEDLQAQQRAATSALASSVLGLIALILSGIGVWYVKRTLDATLEAVEDTSAATEAMLRQNEIAEEAMQRQLRAYVHIEACRMLQFDDQRKPVFRFKMVNMGQTPALQLRVKCYVKFTEQHPHEHKIFFNQDEVSSVNDLGGGGSFGESGKHVTIPMRPERMAAFLNGQLNIVMGILLRYRDVFGVQRVRMGRYMMTKDQMVLPDAGDFVACGKNCQGN